MGYSIFSVGQMNITSGMVLVPFVFGIGFIFYNVKNWIGWVLAGASIAMFFFGIITSINFRMQRMSAFSLIMMITLFIGGIGLFISSLRDVKGKES